MPLNNEQTVLSRLVKAILNAAAYNPEVQAAPACILWPDKDRPVGGRDSQAAKGAAAIICIGRLLAREPYRPRYLASVRAGGDSFARAREPVRKQGGGCST